MSKNFLVSLLDKLGVPKEDLVFSDKWVNFQCLFGHLHSSGKDNSPSAGIYLESPHSYNCFGCKTKGTLRKIVIQLKTERPKMSVDWDGVLSMIDTNVETDTLRVPPVDQDEASLTPTIYPDYWLENFEDAYTELEVHPYLLSRGVPPTTAKLLDIKYDPVRDRVMFPIRDRFYRLLGAQGRSLGSNGLRYYCYPHPLSNKVENKFALIGEERVEPLYPLVVTEGPFDMASVARLYPNVVCTMTSGASKLRLRRLLTLASEFVIFYDSGNAGEVGATDLSRALKSHGKKFVFLDPSDYGAEDPGEMDIVQLDKALKKVIKHGY